MKLYLVLLCVLWIPFSTLAFSLSEDDESTITDELYPILDPQEAPLMESPEEYQQTQVGKTTGPLEGTLIPISHGSFASPDDDEAQEAATKAIQQAFLKVADVIQNLINETEKVRALYRQKKSIDYANFKKVFTKLSSKTHRRIKNQFLTLDSINQYMDIMDSCTNHPCVITMFDTTKSLILFANSLLEEKHRKFKFKDEGTSFTTQILTNLIASLDSSDQRRFLLGELQLVYTHKQSASQFWDHALGTDRRALGESSYPIKSSDLKSFNLYLAQRQIAKINQVMGIKNSDDPRFKQYAHSITLRCYHKKDDHNGWGFDAIVGYLGKHICEDSDSDLQYSLRGLSLGLAAGGFVNGGLIIKIFSPTPILPTGVWFGVNAFGGYAGIGYVATLSNRKGAIAFLIQGGVGAGIGVNLKSIRISEIK